MWLQPTRKYERNDHRQLRVSVGARRSRLRRAAARAAAARQLIFFFLPIRNDFPSSNLDDETWMLISGLVQPLEAFGYMVCLIFLICPDSWTE